MQTIIEDLNWRYATKQFDTSKKISDLDLETLKEAVRLTATSYGLQPMKVLVVTNPEIREQLTAASWGQRPVADASHLFVFCASTQLPDQEIEDYMQRISKSRNVAREQLDGFFKMIKNTAGSWDAKSYTTWTSKQTYIALGTLLQSCAALRIDSLPMEGFQTEKINEILDLERQNLTATLLCPVGYRHEEDTTQHNTKVRKSTKELYEEI